MANLFSQLFSQFGPAPAQRMDQGGGEYTGRIPGVYEGDDTYIPELRAMATPSAVAPSDMGTKWSNAQAEARRRVLAKMQQERFQSQPDSNVAIPRTPQHVSVLNETFDDTATKTPSTIADAAVTPGATSTGTSWLPLEGIAKKAGGLVPEAMWDLGFGTIESIMKNVQRDFDQGSGALDPTSQNNYLQQLIKAGANDETIARLMDKFMPAVKTAASAIPNLQNNEWLATQFDEYMPKIEGAGNEIVQFARNQGNLYSSFYGPMFDKFKTTLGTWAIPSNMPNPAPTEGGPFQSQMVPDEGGMLQRQGVANPLMDNSVIIPQDQSWSGGFMDQPPGRGLDKAGWLEKSPLGQMFRDKSETSDIVDALSQGNINPITRQPRQTAKEKLTNLGEGIHSVAGDTVDWTADHARGVGIAAAGGAGLNLAYNRTDIGKLKTQLRNADTDFARKNIQARIDEKKAQRRAKFKKDHLPKGVRNFNTTKLLAVVGGIAFGLGAVDFVLAAGGGDEDVATAWAMDFVDNNPGIMKGIEAGTQLMDPIGTALGGSEVLSKRMGPASENYWATPGIGRAAGGTADPTWRN